MSCTPDAIVCDDTGTSSAVDLLLVGLGGLLLLVAALGVVALLRRRRVRRAPVVRVQVSADGDVLHRRV